jgi:hypothetical protein
MSASLHLLRDRAPHATAAPSLVRAVGVRKT